MSDHSLATPDHHHEAATDQWSWADQADDLTLEAEIGLSWAQPAMEWLATLTIPTPTRILDVGAGTGVFSTALAEQFTAARVTAVDGNEALLTRAEARAATYGVTDRIDTVTASLDGDLSALPPADLIWASRVLHHVPDPSATVIALKQRLNPAGVLAVVEGGLPIRFLPDECGVGAPGLLARIEAATSSAIHHRLREEHAEGTTRSALDWPAQLTATGLIDATTRSFLLDLPAPVAPQVRRWLLQRLAQTRTGLADALGAEDLEAIDRLLDTDDTLGLAQRPDLFLLGAVTVHTGRQPA